MIENGTSATTPKSETKPTMKRRMDDLDYTERNIYMITLAIEGRRPLLGSLVGRVDAGADSAEHPDVRLSLIGECVNRALLQIPRFFPQVRLMGKQIMPDHVHFILFVTERMPVHLGQVVNGFKVGCRKAVRERLSVSQYDTARDTQGRQLSGKQGEATQGREQARGEAAQGKEQVQSGKDAAELAVAWSDVLQQAKSQKAGARQEPARLAEAGVLWERGYHDRVLYGQGQLDAMLKYIQDNPRRLLVKRSHPEFFCLKTVRVEGVRLYAYGNAELLNCPLRLPVKCSRSILYNELEAQCASLLARKEEEAVLVSPFISKGERHIEQAAVEHGMAVIKLLDNGFSPYFKPWGMYFDLCAAGHLLLLSPYEYKMGKTVLTRTMCQQLNTITELLCR